MNSSPRNESGEGLLSRMAADQQAVGVQNPRQLAEGGGRDGGDGEDDGNLMMVVMEMVMARRRWTKERDRRRWRGRRVVAVVMGVRTGDEDVVEGEGELTREREVRRHRGREWIGGDGMAQKGGSATDGGEVWADDDGEGCGLTTTVKGRMVGSMMKGRPKVKVGGGWVAVMMSKGEGEGWRRPEEMAVNGVRELGQESGFDLGLIMVGLL